MKRKSNTDKLYAKLLIFAEELHMGNKRRIRNGFILRCCRCCSL